MYTIDYIDSSVNEFSKLNFITTDHGSRYLLQIADYCKLIRLKKSILSFASVHI